MATSRKTVLAIKSYQNQAQVLVKNYLLADRFIPYTSIRRHVFVQSGILCLSIVTCSNFFSSLTANVTYILCSVKG